MRRDWKVKSHNYGTWMELHVNLDGVCILEADINTRESTTRVLARNGHPTMAKRASITFSWELSSQEVMQLAWLPEEYGFCEASGSITKNKCPACARFMERKYVRLERDGCTKCTFFCWKCSEHRTRRSVCVHCGGDICNTCDGVANICRICIESRTTWRRV